MLSSSENWCKYDIVRCGVEPSVFSLRRSPENAVPVILCVGRLVAAKGQAVLLEASGVLMKAGVVHQLRIVGTGPDEQKLRNRVESQGWSHVTMTGAMGQDGVRNEYVEADLFVLASFAEGVPVVLMEAMACGVPVISTRIAGIPELVEDGKNGILVAPGDVDGLAAAMRLLIESAEMRRLLGAAAREKVAREYDLSRNGEAMAELFERYLDVAA
jgi:glycosyltransferase involved in cell wall biosynthesis